MIELVCTQQILIYVLLMTNNLKNRFLKNLAILLWILSIFSTSTSYAALTWDTLADWTQVLNATRWNLVVSKMIELDATFTTTNNAAQNLTAPINTVNSTVTSLWSSISTSSGNLNSLGTSITTLNSSYTSSQAKYTSLNWTVAWLATASTAGTTYVKKSWDVTSGIVNLPWLKTSTSNWIVKGTGWLLKFTTDSSAIANPQFKWMDSAGIERMVLDITMWELVKKWGKIHFTNTGSTVNDGAIWQAIINASGLDIVGIWSTTPTRKINVFWMINAYNNFIVNWGIVYSPKYYFGVSWTSMEINGWSGITVELTDWTSKFRVVNPTTWSGYISISWSWVFNREWTAGESLVTISPSESTISGNGPSLQVQSKDSGNAYVDFLKLVFNDSLSNWTNNRGIDLYYLTNQAWNGNTCWSMLWTAAGCRKIFSITSGFNWTTTNIPVITTNGDFTVDNTTNYVWDDVKLNSPVYLSGMLLLWSLSADPASVANWQIYYNTTSNKNRCVENGVWKDCGGTPTVTWSYLVNDQSYNMIYNGDFEKGTGTITTSWLVWWVWSTDSTRWTSVINGVGKVGYDSTVSYKWSWSMRLETTGASSYIETQNEPVWYFNKSPLSISVKPSTQYKFSYRMKTQYVSWDSITGAMWWIWLSNDSNVSKWEYSCAGVKTTQDWTFCNVTFTTTADATLAHIQLRIYWHNGAWTLVMKAWFDEMKLEEIWATFPNMNITTPSGGTVCLWKWCTTKKNWSTLDFAWISCKQIKTDYPSSTDWLYWIKPDPTVSTTKVYCDMTTDWGWWMLWVRIIPTAWNPHKISSASGILTSNSQTTFAKLDDYFINEAASERIFRLQCWVNTNYFKTRDWAFKWTHNTSYSQWDISRSTTYAGTYYLGWHSNWTYYGLSSYMNQAGTNTLWSNHINYADLSYQWSQWCYTSWAWWQSGNLWIK